MKKIVEELVECGEQEEKRYFFVWVLYYVFMHICVSYLFPKICQMKAEASIINQKDFCLNL